MRKFGENQNLFQILLIKVNRDMFSFPFNKIYFHNNSSLKQYLGGTILEFLILLFLINISVGFLAQTFEPAPPPPPQSGMFDYRVPPWIDSKLCKRRLLLIFRQNLHENLLLRKSLKEKVMSVQRSEEHIKMHNKTLSQK